MDESNPLHQHKGHQLKTEFIVQQYYTVLIDESRIDAHRHEYKPDSEDRAKWVEEHFARLHRMFQAILADEKALYAVVEYQVLAECETDRQWQTLLKENYGEEIGFPQLLTRVADCFTQEDKGWLADLLKSNEKAHEERTDGYDLEELAECFKVEASGWNVGPHTH